MRNKPYIIAYTPFEEQTLEKLRQVGDVHVIDKKQGSFRDQLAQHLPHVQALIGSGLKVNAELLDQAPNLKIVSNYSVGYDNFDIPELTKRGIMATNTPDVLTETTADLIFGILMATARRIPQLDRLVKDGKWTASVGRELFGTDVYGKTLGMIGLGRIGTAIARRGKFGFNMPILYHNRSRSEAAEAELGAQYCSLDELLKQSDYVCLMTPLSPETMNLIGEREFKLMKETAIFINGSRGATVDEEALIHALETKQIAAAGLDVYVKEPLPANSSLLNMEHVVTLPHVGSATIATRDAMEALAADNVIAGVTGQKPPTLINQEVWRD
ncbi:D-glycerate dehydrogenase [Paenibacillus albiflavus]|uniref:D-glycerate dehydrogenase n=1 Tax=Paenibacillus albiflavus TaxID=2545760 RepID=A0A4R4EEN6_9BACL|nr:D-glycerate dehydrogenase [Paenibacillus albiflavus]TCZ77713.1 D-glycerate dehydrogenase [Paenibacillus albiflavus]